MPEHNPAVVHLAIQLENGLRVNFTDVNVQQRALNPPSTALTAFFTLCQEEAFPMTRMYSEMPSYYTWNVIKEAFVRRRREEPVDGQNWHFQRKYIW